MTTEKITLHSPADVDAFITHTLGFHPARSLALVGMTGKTLGATLRVDIDPQADVAALAEWTATLTAREGRCDGAMVVLYHDGPNTDRHPYAALVAALEDELPRHGLHVDAVLEVTGGMARSYHHPGDAVPVEAGPPTPADRIAPDTETPAAMVAGFLATIPTATAAPLRKRVAARMERLAPDCFDPNVCLKEWHTVLTASTDSAHWLTEHPGKLARMIHGLRHHLLRDALVATAAVGPRLGRQALAGTDEAIERWAPVFTGSTRSRPRWDTIDALERVLSVVAAVTDEGTPDRSAVLSIMCWIEWCRGRGSRAGGYLDRCPPDYPLAVLLHELLDRSLVCPWARNPDHAWTSTRARA